MILMLGSVMPTEIIVEQIKEGLTHYNETGQVDKMLVPCTLLLSKQTTDDQGLEKTMTQMDNLDRAARIIDTDPLKQ